MATVLGAGGVCEGLLGGVGVRQRHHHAVLTALCQESQTQVMWPTLSLAWVPVTPMDHPLGSQGINHKAVKVTIQE